MECFEDVDRLQIQNGKIYMPQQDFPNIGINLIFVNNIIFFQE